MLLVALSSGAAYASSEARAFAQAEPAPASYEPPPNLSVTPDSNQPSPTTRHMLESREAREHLWTVVVQPRVVIALQPRAGLPRIGFGAGGSIGRMLVTRGVVRFGLQFSFAFERQQRDQRSSDGTYLGLQDLDHASFSLDLRLEALVYHGFMRPWIAVGPGLSIGLYQGFDTTQMPPALIATTTVVAAIRASAGVAFRVWRMVELGPHVEVLATFGGPEVGTLKQAVFAPGNLSVGLDLGFRF